MKTQTLLGTLAAVVLFSPLSGCGQRPTPAATSKTKSAKVVKRPPALGPIAKQANTEVQTLKVNAANTYRSITVRQQGDNTLVYTFVLRHRLGEVDHSALAAGLMTGVAGSLKHVYRVRPGTKTVLVLLDPKQTPVLKTQVTKQKLARLQGQN